MDAPTYQPISMLAITSLLSDLKESIPNMLISVVSLLHSELAVLGELTSHLVDKM